jgi:TRAP-type mannitol/chloroaromatic compound transport system permease small subunit
MFDVITRKIDFIRIGMAELNLRWLNPIIFQDLEWHLHGVILFLSFGFGYLMNAHVRVDIFREMLSHRKQAWFEFFGLLLFAIPYLTLITYFAIQFVLLSYSQGEGSESLTGVGMRYIIKSFMVIGFLLLWAAFIATILRLVTYLFGDARIQHAAEGQLAVFAESAELEKHRQELEQAAARQVHREASQ